VQKGGVMGMMGVFLLGYSADTIKGVFTQRTQGPQ
jgi:hypothetical protein